jgi:cation:H+ antiporter
MLGAFGWFALGLLLIGLGADSLVKGLQALALRVGASAFAVGVLAACFGGSLPDLAVNVDAVRLDHTDLALGNIIGSGIVNVGLILGLAACWRPLEVGLPLARPLLASALAAAAALMAMSWNGRIGYLDGAALVAGFVALATYATRHGPTRAYAPARAALAAVAATRGGALRTTVRVLLGVVLLGYGAHLAVEQALALAQALAWSELLTGLTLLAVGSSLPQLAVTLLAAWRGHGDEVIAGVVGSTVLNLLLILGVTALVHPLPVARSLVLLEIPALIAFTLALYPIMAGDRRIARGEGVALLAAFVALSAFQLAVAR